MAKIIVEQVQGGSGGTALTVPTAAATVNNQAVVGSTAGVLSHSPIALPAAASGANNRPLVGATSGATSFSPLALPAADGAANKPITTNGSGQLQFGAVALPAADGTANQVLTTNGSGVGSWGTISSSPVIDDHILSTGMVISSSARQNVYSTGEWSSSGPNSTYYNNLQDASSQGQAWNMLMGDGKPDATNDQFFYSNDYGSDYRRELMFAHNRRMGHNMRSLYYHDNASTGNTYSGITLSCIPIRNHASSGSTNVTIKAVRSTGSNNYGGSCNMYYTPTFSSGTNYANATGGAWTVLNSHASNDDTYEYTCTVPVAAGVTVLLFMSSCHRYHTTYRYKDTHTWYDLHTAFASDIKCDQRMLHALHMGRQPAQTNSTHTPYELYTTCATLFGDR